MTQSQKYVYGMQISYRFMIYLIYDMMQNIFLHQQQTLKKHIDSVS